MTDSEIRDLELRARSALTRACAMSLAREAVDLKYKSGHYADVIQCLDKETREKLAEILLGVK